MLTIGGIYLGNKQTYTIEERLRIDNNTIKQHERTIRILVEKFNGMHIDKSKKDSGRPKKKIQGFEKVYKDWKNGRITAGEAIKQLNTNKSTFYRKVKDFENSIFEEDNKDSMQDEKLKRQIENEVQQLIKYGWPDADGFEQDDNFENFGSDYDDTSYDSIFDDSEQYKGGW